MRTRDQLLQVLLEEVKRSEVKYGICTDCDWLYTSKEFSPEEYRAVKQILRVWLPFPRYGFMCWPMDQDGKNQRISFLENLIVRYQRSEKENGITWLKKQLKIT
ncbi:MULTISPECIES: hypothetical protein [unclassified Paraflavitalea]|uniref:hypothetical protein n=1 Tax=unclassified Paraflavitalea TaxID=2798305 RepID=UPI003D32FA03